jgi:hypothetical protein
MNPSLYLFKYTYKIEDSKINKLISISALGRSSLIVVENVKGFVTPASVIRVKKKYDSKLSDTEAPTAARNFIEFVKILLKYHEK